MLKYYLALTNYCNRCCDYCSMHSSPSGKTFLPLEWIYKTFDNIKNDFEVQLEGGEPSLHPSYGDIIYYFKIHPWCKTIIVTTNGVGHYQEDLIKPFFLNIDKPLIYKPSINAYLIKRDDHIFERCINLKRIFKSMPDKKLLINVRLRKEPFDKDQWIVDKLKEHGLLECSNVFFYQRYGRAKEMLDYDEPFIIPNPVDFHLIAPDGTDFGQDLIGRSEYMKWLALK